MELGFSVNHDEYRFPVATIEEAQRVFNTFRTSLDGVGFSSRELTTTPVVWSDGKLVAKLNYNGTLIDLAAEAVAKHDRDTLSMMKSRVRRKY